jgi:hypothetical protein
MKSSSNKIKKKAEKAPEIPVTEVKLAENTGNSDFAAEIEKSRAMIDGADRPAEKKKVGRPSKEAKEAELAEQKAAQAEVLKQMVPAEGLGELVALPFHLASLQTGFQGFQLTENEKRAIVPSFHAVLAQYAPQVSGENMALIAFSGALFSIGLGKYMAYLEFRKGSPKNIENGESISEQPKVERPAAPMQVDAQGFPLVRV